LAQSKIIPKLISLECRMGLKRLLRKKKILK